MDTCTKISKTLGVNASKYAFARAKYSDFVQRRDSHDDELIRASDVRDKIDAESIFR